MYNLYSPNHICSCSFSVELFPWQLYDMASRVCKLCTLNYDLVDIELVDET